jgi:hypothetical protein
MTDINTIIQFVPNTQEHVLVNTRNSCCYALLRSFTLTGSGETKTLSLIYPHKALDPDFLEANVSVPCSGLLSGKSNVEADFDPGNFEPQCGSGAELHLG